MQKTLLGFPNFQKVFGDSRAFDCTIRNKNFFIFFTREPEPEWMQEKEGYSYNDGDTSKRLIGYFRDPDETDFDEKLFLIFFNIDGYVFPSCEMTYTPLEQVVCFDGYEKYLVGGSGQSEEEVSNLILGARKSNVIGDKIYVAQSRRRVIYRVDEEEWKSLGNDISVPEDKPARYKIERGFYGVDGFDENHIYAVGGKGDVWRCIDNEWTECGFPTNTDLETVCCAGDGNVYVSGSMSDTYVGKEDNWEKVKGAGSTLPFKDMVWHDDRVWCSNDYGIWWIKDGKLSLADVPDEVRGCSGSLCSRFGMLLVAGYGGGALLEKDEWTLLF